MSDHRYIVHGLGVCSDLPLPELVPAHDSPADVHVRLGEGAPTTALPAAPHGAGGSAGRTFHWAVEDVGHFEVRDGSEIVVYPRGDDVEPRALRFVVLGVALGVLFEQRGMLTLHMSVVALDGHGVGFVGGHEAGKSTTAAAFARRGHPVVTDDMAPVDLLSGPRPTVAPGVPRMKLWPEAAHALACGGGSLSQLFEGAEKLSWHDPRKWQCAPVELARIYVLSPHTSTGVVALEPFEPFLALAHNSYAARLGGVHGRSETGSHFRRCAQLANAVSMRMLRVRKGLGRLDEVVDEVENDVRYGVYA